MSSHLPSNHMASFVLGHWWVDLYTRPLPIVLRVPSPIIILHGRYGLCLLLSSHQSPKDGVACRMADSRGGDCTNWSPN
jgi:hypothetical protein